MDIKLVDGTIVKNVPKGVTPEQVQAKFDARKSRDEGIGGMDLVKSLASGVNRLGSSLAGMADNSIIGDAFRAVDGTPMREQVKPSPFDTPEIAAKKEKLAEEYLKAEPVTKKVQKFFSDNAETWNEEQSAPAKNIRSYVNSGKGFVDTAGRYLKHPSAGVMSAVESLPMMAPLILTKGAPATTQLTIGAMHESAANAEDARQGALEDAKRNGATAAQALEASDRARELAFAATMATMPINAVGGVNALRRLTGRTTTEGAKHGLAEIPKQMLAEAGQEFLQEGSSKVAQNMGAQQTYDSDRNVLDGAAVAGLHGAVAGGIMGGAMGTLAVPEGAAPEAEPTPVNPQPTPQASPDAQAAQDRKAELDAIRQQRPLTPEEQDDADVADAIISRGAPQGQPVQEPQPAAPVDANTPPPVEQPPAQPAPGLSGVVQRHTQSAAPSLDAAFSDAIQTGQSPDFAGLAQQTGIDRNSLVDQFNAKRTEHVRKQGLMDLAEQGDLNALRSAASEITVDPQQQDQLIEEAVAGNEQRKAEALAASQQQGAQAQQQAQQSAQQQAEKDKYDQTYGKMLDEAVAALEGGQTEVKTFLPIKKKYSASGLNATDVNGVIDHAKQVIAEKQQKAARHEQAVTEAMPHLQSGDEASAVLAMDQAGVTDDADVQSVLKEANKRIRQDSKKPAGTQSVPAGQQAAPVDPLSAAVAEVKAAQAAGKKVNLAAIAKKHSITIMDVAKGVAAKPEQAAPKAKPSQPLALPAPQGPATTGDVMVSRNGKVMSQAEADALAAASDAEKKQMRRDMAEEAGNPTGIPTGMKPKVEQPARTEQKAVLPNLILRTDGNPFPDTKQATRVLASKKLEDTHEVVSVEGGKAIAPKKYVSKAPNQVDPEKDDILTAIAKLGGIDRAQAKRQGVDPADFRRRAGGIQFVFRKNGGKELDRMAEALSEMDYPVTENGKYTVNALLDSLDSALRGASIGTPQFHEAQAQAQAMQEAQALEQAMYEEEAEQRKIDATFDSPGNSAEPDWLSFGADDFVSSILDGDITPNAVIASELAGIENERTVTGTPEAAGQKVDANPAPSSGAKGIAAAAGGGTERQQKGKGDSQPDSAVQDFGLKAQTEAERIAEEQRVRAALDAKAKADEQARLKAKADKEIGGFLLSGSDAPADVAMAHGQKDIFAPQTRGEKAAKAASAPSTEPVKWFGSREKAEAWIAKNGPDYHVVQAGPSRFEVFAGKKPATPNQINKQGNPASKRLGVNYRGETLYEDEMGVRSYATGGVLVSESVSIIPGKGIERGELTKEYKTADELAAEKGQESGKAAPAEDLDSMFDDVLAEVTGKNQAESAPATASESGYAYPKEIADLLLSELKAQKQRVLRLTGGDALKLKAAATRLQAMRSVVSEAEDTLIPDALAGNLGALAKIEAAGFADTADAISEILSPTPAKRTAGQAAVSAAKNTGMALGDAIDGLGKLFGGNKLSSGLTFDEKTYAKAKPYFIAAISHLRAAGGDLREAMRAVVRMVVDKFGADAAGNMKPYVVQFIADVRDGKIDDPAATLSNSDTKEATGNDVRKLDTTGAGTLEGVSSGEVQRPETEQPAGAGADGSSRGNSEGNGRVPGAGVQRDGGVGTDAQSVPASGTGERGRVGGRGRRGGRGTGGTVSESVSANNERGAVSGGRRIADSSDSSQPQVALEPGRIDPPQLPDDFIIEDDLALGEGGQRTKYKQNVEAIKLVKALDAEGRTATTEEQKIIAKYVGWGGIPQAFDPSNSDWSAQYSELNSILTKEEYESARESTQYAHYTSREIIGAMYSALRQFGFTGGNVLEAGGGVGNFIGLMPVEMRTNGKVTLIERERIASAIARHLYPRQNVRTADFTEFGKGQDGQYDAQIGNPPFASTPLTDKSDRRHLTGLSIHNYFIAKGIDMLRPGGITAVVVTNSFMDATGDRARKYIGERAKLLGAIRLPNNAFSKNANTQVTTDIIFLQKLPEAEWGSKSARDSAKQWIDTANVSDPKGGKDIPLNRYFVSNPQMMLGQWGRFGTMRGPDQPALVARQGQNTDDLLQKAVASLPKDVFKSLSEERKKAMESALLEKLHDDTVSEGGFYADGGKLWRRVNDVAGEEMAEAITASTIISGTKPIGENGVSRLMQLAALRKTMRGLLAAEIADNVKSMDALRADLNRQYDAYVRDNGKLNDTTTKRLMRDDPDYPLLAALEMDYEPGMGPAAAKREGIKSYSSKAKKAAIFDRRVIEARKPVTAADSPQDAINISMAERGRLDADYVGRLLGIPSEEVLDQLSSGASPLLFRDPASGEYVLRDAYLSGNVREKLKQAQAAGMSSNVRALEEVLPEDVPASQISVRLGSPWVPMDVYRDFAKHLFGEGTKTLVSYISANGSFNGVIKPESDVIAMTKFGTKSYPGDALMLALMNNRQIKVTYRDSDGKTHTDQKATEEANAKADEIKQAFQDWAFKDADRAELMARSYNDANNNYVVRKYDGSWLSFPGKVPDAIITFRRHQRNAIARTVQDRTSLYDHVVGAGKTFTAIASAMELKRTGLANKPMMVVPNHLVGQWAADFYRLYPGAKVLAATKKDFERTNRRKFMAKIASGDWDAIIIAHSSFSYIKPNPEFELQFNQGQIDGIVRDIEAVKAEDGEEQQKKRTVKQLEKLKESLENKIARLRDKPMDDLLDFQQLGVDQLFVDEAHLFKNLMFGTKMQNVRGLGDPAGSQRAYDMYLKTRQLMDQNGRGQGVVFMTGTPVSNSLAEMYHMMRYLMPQQMEQLGFDSFDAWANTFASVNQVWMQNASGDGFKAQNRMSSFDNIPELLKMFDQVADTVTMDDIKAAFREENNGKEFPLPPLATGRRIPVPLEKSDAQIEYMEEIAKRAKALEQRKGPPQKGDDNVLVLMTDARKAAMDIRLVNPDVMGREAGGRIDRASDEIVSRWKKYADQRGVQLVFSDLGTPKSAVKAELKEYEALMARVNAAANQDVIDDANLGVESALDILADAEDAQNTIEAKGADWLGSIQAAQRGFSVYDDLKSALVEKGIPENQIAFIHDFNTDDQKAALFRKVNNGDIRVMVGSTPKMGAGTNVQKRLVALHHLDVPWKPSDLEQREGRIIRQGNLLSDEEVDRKPNPLRIPGFEVEILAYVTKDTLDMRMWQIQETKLKMINQLRSRQIDRDMENAFEEMEMSAGEMQAAATGNMDLLREIQLRTEVQKLEKKQRAFDAGRADVISGLRRAKAQMESIPGQILRAKVLAEGADKVRNLYLEHVNSFKATINGKDYTDRTAASQALRDMTEAVETGDDGKERKAKLDVTLNGEHYTNRQKLAEAFARLNGDREPFVFEADGEVMYRLEDALDAILDDIEAAKESNAPRVIGSMGPFTVSIEYEGVSAGDRDTFNVYAEIGDADVSAVVRGGEDDRATGRNIARAVRDMVRDAPNGLESEMKRLEKAKKTVADYEKIDTSEAWPDGDKLERLRAEHRAILERMNGPTEASTDPGDAKFSVSQGSEDLEFAADFLTQLADADEIFRYPVSKAKSLPAIMADVFPEAKHIGDDSRPDERDESGADKRTLFRTEFGKPFHVYERGDQVWIDVSKLSEGDKGAGVYAAVGNYAHNNRKVFVGDPAGLSEAAVVRRTNAMLSLALQFGSTDFMDAAKEQIAGNPENGIAPLKWRGSDLDKITALIDTVLQNIKAKYPGVSDARYDFAGRRFVDRNNLPIQRGGDRSFDSAAKSGMGRAARAGQASLRRGILLQSLVSSESGQRPGILEQVLRRGGALGLARNGLDGVFSASNTDASGANSAALTTTTAREILAADPVLSKALPFIEVKSSRDGVPAGAEVVGAEGYYHNGKITLFPENIKATPTQTAEERLKWVAFHEVTHRGVANLSESREYMAELQQAGKNPFIKNLAKKIYAKRQGTPYEVSMEVAIEEALAEANAALQTGSSKTIKAQYGLHFPLAIRGRAKSAIARFFEAVKRIYNKLTGRGLTNEQVGDLLRKTHEAGMGPGDGPKGGKKFSAPPAPGQPPSRSVFASVAKQWMFQKWTETLGTQLNTAMLEPLFKPTYQLVQRYLQHTSNDAYDAISVAPNLLGRLEDINDYWRETKNSFNPYRFRKINSDREAAAVPLFEGTRFDKKVYSDAVLKRVYNLTDDQVAVYREARAAIEASLDSHAKSVITKILLDAGAVEFSDIDTLVNRDLPADDYMEELRQRLGADILAANDAIAIQKTALSAAGVTAQDKASIQASIKKGSRRVELLEEAAKRIDSTEGTLSQLKREGYFPLMRWGKYTVTVKDAGGNVVDFRMVETLREKVALSEALTKQYHGQGMTVTSGTMDEGRFKDFRGMSPETLALFAKELGVDNDEAYQEYLKLALPGQSALKRRIHRKGDNGEGIAGFSMDIQRTLASFVMGNARHSARNIYGSAITKSVDAIPGERGDVRGLARNLAEFVTQPDENSTSVSIRNMLFVWNMGASVAFGALNLSQPWMMTLPWLSQFSGIGSVVELMGKASKTAAIAQKNGTVPQEYYAEYQQAVREGHVDPQNVFMLQGIERGGSGLGSSLLKTVSHGMGMIAAATESYNRKLTLFAALDVARAKGLPWLKSKGFDSAYAFAVQAVAETQGVYNKGNRPAWARGPIGAVLLVFKQYAVNWIEMAVRMGRNHYGEDRMRKGLMMMLGLLFAMAGAMGMPGAEDLKDIAETAMGSAGKPVNIERQMQMTLGKGMADAVMAGPMNALVLNSIGLDMHGRMSMGNIIPGTGAFNPYTSTDAKLSEGISVMGAGTGLLKKGSDAVAAAQDGRLLDAAQSAAPRAIESIMKGVRMMAEGKARDARGNVLMETTPWDAAAKIIDFQPSSVAISQRERGRRFQDKNILMVARTSMRNRLITAYEEKDAEKIRDAEQALDEWNQDNPLYQIKLKKRDLRKAAKKRGASWMKREETPKGLEWMDEYADQENGQ